jgi:hypothetical protein
MPRAEAGTPKALSRAMKVKKKKKILFRVLNLLDFIIKKL